MLNSVLEELASMGSEENVRGMARFGIKSKARILGVPKPKIRELAKKIGKDNELALLLWDSCVHEAKILATLVADPSTFPEELADKWVSEVDNWDLCDQLVFNLIWKTDYAYRKALEWVKREEEFVKRAGFALIAKLAISSKIKDEAFLRFLDLIEGCEDERKYVQKTVSWALRQIGKRNEFLHEKAMETAERMLGMGGVRRKIALEAIKELKSEKVLRRVKKRGRYL